MKNEHGVMPPSNEWVMKNFGKYLLFFAIFWIFLNFVVGLPNPLSFIFSIFLSYITIRILEKARDKKKKVKK